MPCSEVDPGYRFAHWGYLLIRGTRTALAIGKQATGPSSNIPRISIVYSDRQWVRGEVVVMSDKILDRPAMLLTLIAGLLFVLWIIAGYGPEGISAESVAQQHVARAQ